MEANAAFAGAGIAMMTPMFWRDELAAGRLVQPFPHSTSPTAATGWSIPKAAATSPRSPPSATGSWPRPRPRRRANPPKSSSQPQ